MSELDDIDDRPTTPAFFATGGLEHHASAQTRPVRFTSRDRIPA